MNGRENEDGNMKFLHECQRTKGIVMLQKVGHQVIKSKGCMDIDTLGCVQRLNRSIHVPWRLFAQHLLAEVQTIEDC